MTSELNVKSPFMNQPLPHHHQNPPMPQIIIQKILYYKVQNPIHRYSTSCKINQAQSISQHSLEEPNGYFDVDEGYLRRNMLVTTSRCWSQFLTILVTNIHYDASRFLSPPPYRKFDRSVGLSPLYVQTKRITVVQYQPMLK